MAWIAAQLSAGPTLASGQRMRYAVLLPTGFDPGRKNRVLFWMHTNDSGNRAYPNGDVVEMVRIIGADGWFNNPQFQAMFPNTIVVCPACDQTADHSGATLNFGGYGPVNAENEQSLPLIAREVIAKWSGDPARVFAAGGSLGGICGWGLAVDHNAINGKFTKTFAAIIAEAGKLVRDGISVQSVVDQIRNVPIFAIHGTSDGTVAIDWDRSVWDALSGGQPRPGPPGARAGNSQFFYLEDQARGHDVWDFYPPTGAGKPVYDWLFSQAAPGSVVTAPGPVTAAATGAFYVSNGQFIRPDGKVFIARGINIRSDQFPAVISNDACTPLLSYFPDINMVRFYYEAGKSPYQLTKFYEPMVSRLTAKKIVVAFEDHTGISQPPYTGAALAAELAWYSSLAQTYKNNPYVWFGTFNEPGKGTDLAGIATQERAIYDAIRATGNTNPILMEVPSGGNPGTVGASARGYDGKGPMTPALFSTMKNVGWDLHHYGWISKYSNDPVAVKTALQGSVASGSGIAACQSIQSADGVMPVIIGEYGNSTTGVAIDANGDLVCRTVAESGYGFLAWAWNPDPQGDQCVNDAGQLLPYGKMISSLISAAAKRDGGNPVAVRVSDLPESANGATIAKASDAAIVNSIGESWTMTASGQVACGGVIDATTSSVVGLNYANHRVVQTNTAGETYSKSVSGDAWNRDGSVPVVASASAIATALGTARAALNQLAALLGSA